jgi:hypothetical protein
MYNFDAMPFQNAWRRGIHFRKHGHKFGAADEFIYEAMADAFMNGPMNTTTQERIRVNRVDRLRLDFTTAHFGTACISPRFVRTFYPVAPLMLAKHGGCAGFLAYECGRVNL